MPQDNDNIRPELMAELETLRPYLHSSAAVHRRGDRGTYRVRTRVPAPDGARVFRSVQLKNCAEAEAVRALLGQWCARPERDKKIEEQPNLAQESREMIGLIAGAFGASEGRRRQILIDYDNAAAGGLFALWKFVHTADFAAKPTRGRPRRGRWY